MNKSFCKINKLWGIFSYHKILFIFYFIFTIHKLFSFQLFITFLMNEFIKKWMQLWEGKKVQT